jgi:glycerophosphoryl diester phosphodiesterase
MAVMYCAERLGTLHSNSKVCLICGVFAAVKPTIISHNGYSGKYPASTSLAYTGAIGAKVDYIDCLVQITKDSVLFCRPTVNLVDSTNIANVTALNPYLATYPDFNNGAQGYYPFDLTWDQITTLRGES